MGQTSKTNKGFQILSRVSGAFWLSKKFTQLPDSTYSHPLPPIKLRLVCMSSISIVIRRRTALHVEGEGGDSADGVLGKDDGQHPELHKPLASQQSRLVHYQCLI